MQIPFHHTRMKYHENKQTAVFDTFCLFACNFVPVRWNAIIAKLKILKTKSILQLGDARLISSFCAKFEMLVVVEWNALKDAEFVVNDTEFSVINKIRWIVICLRKDAEWRIPRVDQNWIGRRIRHPFMISVSIYYIFTIRYYVPLYPNWEYSLIRCQKVHFIKCAPLLIDKKLKNATTKKLKKHKNSIFHTKDFSATKL